MSKDMGQGEIRYLKSMKYRDMHKPYSEFIFYKRFMLVAHGNILSYYDVDKKKWITHYMFEDKNEKDPSNPRVNLNQTFAFMIKK